jgi:hypothetical protein
LLTSDAYLNNRIFLVWRQLNEGPKSELSPKLLLNNNGKYCIHRISPFNHYQ